MVIVSRGDAHRGLLGAFSAQCGAGLIADLFELAVSQILIKELRRRVVGDKDVGPAGVIEVRPDDT